LIFVLKPIHLACCLAALSKAKKVLDKFSVTNPRRTIAGYIAERIISPYTNPRVGARYITRVSDFNDHVPDNLFLVVGDEQLEIQASRVSHAADGGPADGWRIVHGWISDLIADVRQSWNIADCAVFLDCNPSFTIYTELAMSAADRLLIPFSADGSSKRAVRAVLALVYGVSRNPGATQSEFYIKTDQFRMTRPKIYLCRE
jgi:chromosome partitioning protein